MNKINITNQGIGQGRSCIEQHQERELIHYLKQTIEDICDMVRNKMMAPYAVLKCTSGDNRQKMFIDTGIKEIHWLCHVYLPMVLTNVNQRIKNQAQTK